MLPSFDRSTTPRRRFNYNIPASVVLLQCHCRNCHRGKLQMYLLRQFCWNRVKFFFTIHRRHRHKKWWTRILKFEFCDFWDFFWKFSKRRREVPLWSIWAIMIAAKLDQSRVLVTKFHQNRLMLKGRSAGQRHTHTDRQTDSQTNSAKNNGPSGLQMGQKNEWLRKIVFEVIVLSSDGSAFQALGAATMNALRVWHETAMTLTNYIFSTTATTFHFVLQASFPEILQLASVLSKVNLHGRFSQGKYRSVAEPTVKAAQGETSV